MDILLNGMAAVIVIVLGKLLFVQKYKNVPGFSALFGAV